MGHAGRRPIRVSLAHVAAVAIVVLAMLVALWSLAPPAVRSADPIEAEFSAELAMEHVAAIAVEPHPLGSEAIGRVREYIAGELAALGIEVELQTTTARDPYGAGEVIYVDSRSTDESVATSIRCGGPRPSDVRRRSWGGAVSRCSQ